MRLIDADALIEKIRKLPNAGVRWIVSAEAVFDTILNAPTIEPRRGKWERHHSGPYGYAFRLLYCSECGKDYYDELAERFNYCPNCGADMRGEQDEQE